MENSSMTTCTQLYLLITELSRLRSFYEDVIGLDVARVSDASVSYRTGDCELKLQRDFSEEQLAKYNLEGPPRTNRGHGAIFVLKTDDINAVYHQAVTSDTPSEAVTEPKTVPWGGYMVLVRDPDGYVLELRSPNGAR